MRPATAPSSLRADLFVSPTASSLQAAAALMQPDPSVGSWVFPYADFPGNAKAKGAYPGTMLFSADVPTTGLPEATPGTTVSTCLLPPPPGRPRDSASVSYLPAMRP